MAPTSSNKSGYFQIAIPGEYKYAEHLRIVAGENLIFKPFAKKLDFKDSRKKYLNIGLGPSDELKEPLYRIRIIGFPLDNVDRREITGRFRRFKSKDIYYLDSLSFQFSSYFLADTIWLNKFDLFQN